MWALRSCQRWSHSTLSISPVQDFWLHNIYFKKISDTKNTYMYFWYMIYENDQLTISPVQDPNHNEGFPVEEETGWNMRWKILFGLTSWDRLRPVEDETGEITGENMIWSHLWSVDPFCCLDGSLQPRCPNTYIWGMQQFKHEVYYMYISERCNINTFQALEKSN